MTKPLVSVAVTTYNSGKYVWETLESIRAQSYPNLELLISDDFSTDDTLSICRQWLDLNNARFQSTRIITVPHNTGVSANCNRCIDAANAEWIKFIAGDDILLPNCIEDNMAHVAAHDDVRILFSHVKVFIKDFKPDNVIKVSPGIFPTNLMSELFTAEDQFKRLLISDRIPYTPSYFFNKQALISVGRYDETLRLAEDYPMWLKLTRAGIRLHFMDKITVAYRQHDSALNNIQAKKIVKPLQLKTFGFRKKYVHPFLPWDIVGSERVSFIVASFFEKAGWNVSKSPNQFFFRLLSVYLNPFTYVISFKKRTLGSKDVFYMN